MTVKRRKVNLFFLNFVLYSSFLKYLTVMSSDYIKSWVGGIEEYIPGKTFRDCIKLASNENNYGPSPLVVEAIQEAASNISMYPCRDLDVRDAAAKYCGLEGENIILGNGSDELIDLILKAFKGPVLGFSPTFSYYRICSTIFNEPYFEVKLNTDFSLSSSEFIAESRRANILFLCNPNNPSGSVIPKKTIKEILDEGKITVVDEAYFEFCGVSAVSFLKDYDNLIVLRTFAKAFALAGLRIGYGISNPEIVRLLCKVKQPFNVNSVAQEAALAALDDVAYMKSTVDAMKTDRKRTYTALSDRFDAFKSYANFVLVDTSPLSAGEFFNRLLKEGIIIREFGRFEGFPGEYCRISIGTHEENKKLLDALDKI